MKAIDLHCDTIGELYRLKKEGHPQSILKNSRMVDLEKWRPAITASRFLPCS